MFFLSPLSAFLIDKAGILLYISIIKTGEEIADVKSIFKRILVLFLWLIPALILSSAIRFLCDSVYEALHSYFGSLFPLFSPVTDKAEYAKHDFAMSIITLIFTLFLTVYFSILSDNERYERIISKTDGLYDIKDALPLYAPHFILGDIAASLICALILSIPMPFIPDRFFGFSIMRPLLLPRTICSILPGINGALFGGALIFGLMLLLHLPSLIFSLKVWRSRWLTAFGE